MWQAQPPGGYEGEGVRRYVAVGDTIRYGDLTIQLRRMEPGTEVADPDTAWVTLTGGGMRSEHVWAEGSAWNGQGYHVAVLALHTEKEELASGTAELEIVRASSMPADLRSGAEAGDASRRVRVPHTIRAIAVQHTGSQQPVTAEDNPLRLLQNLQAWGAYARTWWDVPAHFYIGIDGRIYEGRALRYAGDSNVKVDPRGYLFVSLLGNYDLQEPTPAQLASLTSLLAWAASTYDVPVDRIYGQYELGNTESPGRSVRAVLEDGTIHRVVSEQLGRPQPITTRSW